MSNLCRIKRELFSQVRTNTLNACQAKSSCCLLAREYFQREALPDIVQGALLLKLDTECRHAITGHNATGFVSAGRVVVISKTFYLNTYSGVFCLRYELKASNIGHRNAEFSRKQVLQRFSWHKLVFRGRRIKQPFYYSMSTTSGTFIK